jgi:hypothetical protein
MSFNEAKLEKSKKDLNTEIEARLAAIEAEKKKRFYQTDQKLKDLAKSELPNEKLETPKQELTLENRINTRILRRRTLPATEQTERKEAA